MNQQKMYEWAESFKVRRTSVTDESLSILPIEEHILRVDAVIREG